jgi:outer membrane receptor protein involved in Fe transport
VVVSAAVGACLLGTPALAQSASQEGKGAGRQVGEFQDFDELALEDLLQQTVSIAAGVVQRVEEAPGIATVITDDDIRRMGFRTLADVLQTVPGFEVLIDNVGRHRIVVRGVNTRGISVSENVLILFNGHRLNENVWGGATVVNPRISLHNIKQIEVIRGPGSALFGTNAFVGVINLIPYTATTFNGVEAEASVGTFDTGQISATGGRTWGQLGVVGSAMWLDTEGARLPVATDAQSLLDVRDARLYPAISLAPTTTRSGFRGGDVSLNASYRGFSTDARFVDSSSEGLIGRFDIFGTGNSFESRQFILGMKQRVSLAARTSLSAKLSFAQNQMTEVLNPVPPGWIRTRTLVGPSVFPDGLLVDYSNNTRRYAAEVAVDHQLSARNILTATVGYERESTFDLRFLANYNPNTGASVARPVPQNFTLIPSYTRQISSAIVQDAWNVSAQLGVTVGARYDHYSDFGNAFSPRVGIVWRPRRTLYLKGLFGHAFRAPTLTELFTAPPLAFTGNPDLQPSTTDTYELAAGYHAQKLNVSATYFVNLIDDLIVSDRPFTTTEAGGNSMPVNGVPVAVQGVEFEARRKIGLDHVVFGNYTYQRARTQGSVAPATGVPAHSGTLGFTVGFGRFFDVTAMSMLRGERPRLVSDTRRPVDRYVITNLNMRLKQLLDSFEVSMAVDNLFDVNYVSPSPDYRMPGDYPRPGRSVLVKLRYTR